MTTIADQLIEQGEIKGRAEGEARGEARGRRALILKQLALRFGAIPESIRARVESAEPDQLDRVAERVLTAASLEDVFR